MIGQFFHFGGIGAARVQHGPTASVDDARVFTVERDEVVRFAGGVVEVQVREGLPTAAETDDLDVVLTAAIRNGLDDCVQAGNIAAACENADAFFRHARLPRLASRNNACVTPMAFRRQTSHDAAVRSRCRSKALSPQLTLLAAIGLAQHSLYSAASGLRSSRNRKRSTSADTVSRKPPYSSSE